MRRAALVVTAVAAFALVACDLREITVAESEYVVIVEMYLRAGASRQTALLHSTITGVDSLGRVPGAVIRITDSRGAVLSLVPALDTICFVPDDTARQVKRAEGSCYSSRADAPYNVQPGEAYALEVRLPDGGILTGVTQVPGDFRFLRPSTLPVCALAAGLKLNLQWTVSEGAWVYASSAVIRGLKPYLAQQGITLEHDPLRLFGLSISNRDTTILFPTEFGIFQRFDDSYTETLIAIANGLPTGATADITIAAADRNYVNWERGGSFNPSGVIRVASVRGDGTGVFGSLVPRAVQIRVGVTNRPPC